MNHKAATDNGSMDRELPGAALGWQKAEGALIFIAGLAIAWSIGAQMPWWAMILVFFVPDLAFSAYLAGPKIGAFAYNSVHIYGFGAAFIAVGLLLPMPLLVALGALWLAHSGFDRMLGYGLKLPSGFGFTHLGRIGKRQR